MYDKFPPFVLPPPSHPCSQCPGILSYHIAAETWKRLSAQSLDSFTAAPVETNSTHSPGGNEGETAANNGDEAVNGVRDKAQPSKLGMSLQISDTVKVLNCHFCPWSENTSFNQYTMHGPSSFSLAHLWIPNLAILVLWSWWRERGRREREKLALWGDREGVPFMLLVYLTREWG